MPSAKKKKKEKENYHAKMLLIRKTLTIPFYIWLVGNIFLPREIPEKLKWFNFQRRELFFSRYYKIW